jgi:hypothetical protein
VNQELRVRSRDEHSETVQAFVAMIDYLKDAAAAAKRIAGGDLTVDIEPRSERDGSAPRSSRCATGCARPWPSSPRAPPGSPARTSR